MDPRSQLASRQPLVLPALFTPCLPCLLLPAALTFNCAAWVCRQSEDAAPARVMVFAGTEEQAKQLAAPLRTVLWGDHKISGGWWVLERGLDRSKGGTRGNGQSGLIGLMK